MNDEAQRALFELQSDMARVVYHLRKGERLSQIKFAEKYGLPRKSIATLEVGASPVTLRFLVKLATAMNGRVQIRIVPNQRTDQDHPPMTDKQKAEAGGTDTASDLGP